MRIELANQKMLLAHYNARSEVHGEDREPAADIKLEMDTTNDFLIQLHPTLRQALFHFDSARDAEGKTDLADKGSDAPHLRYAALVPPLKWNEEMAGADVTIRPAG